MFDNVCKYLAETFSEDYAAWLLGKPVALTTLSPQELSLEPIRADALILEQSDDLVLHLEFQTEPDETRGCLESPPILRLCSVECPPNSGYRVHTTNNNF